MRAGSVALAIDSANHESSFRPTLHALSFDIED